MSDLTYTERSKFEQFLGMKSGYVLGFSNRQFGEFVLDATGRDIFDEKYNLGSGSKAYRLRAFWQKEDNATVGKLMRELLNFSDQRGPLWEICNLIVARLLKEEKTVTPSETEFLDKQQAVLEQQRSRELRKLQDEFLRLASENDRNAAGIALESCSIDFLRFLAFSPDSLFALRGSK